MSQNTSPSTLAIRAHRLLILPILALLISGLSSKALGAIDYTINDSVWKMLYGVTETQATNPVWKAADDDGDGISNGVEIAAGTNPFNAGSTVKVTTVTATATTVSLTFPTVLGKEYVVQATPSLTGTWTAVTPPVKITGNGSAKTLVADKSSGAFFRVLVQDLDTDGDSVSDWAEQVAGYDHNAQQTNGITDDATAITDALATSNQVTVKANISYALQPPDTTPPTAPINVGQITVARSGTLRFSDINVPLNKTGTAIEGTDYAGLPAIVTIPKNSSFVVLNVTPIANPALKTNRIVTLAAQPGGGYTVAAPGSASVVINPAGNATGTGLTAAYHNQWSATYSTNQGYFAGAAEMSRVDATINFPSGANGWGSAGGPTGMSPVSPDGGFSIRWTGQILPQYSEKYFISFKSDEGAKIWINGVLLIDKWALQNSDEWVNSIELAGGIPYDIVIEYFNNGPGTALAHLYWWSPSQTKQIIPQNRLFPAPTLAQKLTAITSPLTAIGYVGVPFSLNLSTPSTGGTTTYALAVGSAPLPPGLGLNPSTGAISGTPTAAGSYNVAINATNTAAGVITGSSVIDFTIYPSGSVSREILATTGSTIADIVIPTGSPTHDTIANVDDDTDYPADTGERLRGFIVPPKTGNYYFWLAANNAAELWISNDSEPVNRVRHASVAASSGNKVWNASPSQQSPWLALVAGQKYYFEVLRNTGADADDYVAMGWCQDDIGTIPSVAGAPNPDGLRTLIPNGGTLLQGYPLSGTAPSYIFQPYDYPPAPSPTGTLYAANLGPQGSATTKASGSANLRVDPSGTSAVLHFAYSGLSSARTGYHLHTDAFDIHPAGEIIFDIDDIDAFHPELRTADGGYIWNFAASGTFNVAQILDAIQRGKVYLNVHSVNYPNGEIRGNLTLVDGSQTPPNPALYTAPPATDVATNAANAARFLNQATFGASPADIAFVQANGFEGWIDDQLTKTASKTSNDVVAGITSDINNPYPSSLFTSAWWKYSISGQDQLRQRVAFALSEIMVVSWANNTGPLQNNGRILADYYDQLVDFVFPTSGVPDSGNFRGILRSVTLTPAMGLYLDMRGNQKGDVTIGRMPNENYAREIMQLFSVGIYRMWDDGKFVLDSDANLSPTYAQPNIIGLASLLTGWNYSQPNQGNGRLPSSFSPGSDYLNPMVLVPTRHELSSKLLLNNIVSPGATGLTPNVGISTITAGASATVNTSTQHGLKSGDTVTISGVTGGTFTGGLAAINASFQATVTSPTAFTVPVQCTGAAGAGGTVTGAAIVPGAYATTGITPVSGSQADNNGTTLPHPYDQYGMRELDLAMDNIVNNDNVPPYICRQLIQRLITSDPSPGYLYRVVQKFKNNGSGVRGDMVAVIKAILLDGEARRTTASFASSAFGKQREPLMRLTGPARAFPAADYTGTYTQLTGTNSNKFRIVTSAPNDFSQGFTVSLDFKGNYAPPGQSLAPFNVPTSTTYGVGATLGIASVTNLMISTITPGNPTIIETTQPHGLNTGDTATLAGVTGTTSPAINATGFAVTVVNPTTFTIPVNTTRAMQITSIGTGNPCVITTAQPHGMVTGNPVTINGITGGTFSSAINATFTATVTSPTTFTVPSNCTVLPTSIGLSRLTGPCLVTTVQAHGLTSGDSVTISGVSGGTFTPTINGSFAATVMDPTSFTVPSNCTVLPTSVSSAQIVGATTLDVTATGMINVSYSQVAGSNILTVNTSGPPTNVPIPVPNSATTTLKSRVYLQFLSQTTGGGAAIPSDGVYDVEANGSGNFTVITADTPAAARGGNVIIPKLTSSYTPQTSNTVVQFNTNMNHNMLATQNVWVDAPVSTSPLTDAEYTITIVTDEDHMKVSYLPVSSALGTYPKPSGSNNGVTLWPLAPAPMGRSGVVKVNQSSFNIGSTEGTLSQSPLNSPTVFNFFFPDYKYPGTLSNAGIDSPEFQLSTDTNIQNLTNSITNMFIGTGGGNGNLNGLSSFNNGSGTVVMTIEPYMTIPKTSNAGIPALIDELAALLIGGPLEATTKTTIQNFVANNTNFPMTSPTPTNQQKRDRVRAVIQLILTSAEYAVQK